MTDYHRMSVRAKAQFNRDSMVDRPIACARCSVLVQAEDWLTHAERCSGALPTPHPRSRWLHRSKAMGYAVMPATLDRWLVLGLVRVNADGRLCERDVVLCCAWSRALGVL